MKIVTENKGQSIAEPPSASCAAATAVLSDTSKFMCGVSMLGWAYNEEDNIESYLRRGHELLSRSVEDFEIVIVDDGSTDGTKAIIGRVMEELPGIRLVENPGNKGVAYACANAIRNASKEFLFWQTVDWSYDISSLRRFLALLDEADVIAGVRRKPVDAGNRLYKPITALMALFSPKHITGRSDTVGKAFVSLANYCLIRVLFRVPLSDYQNACIYPTRFIQGIRMESDSSFLNPELLFKAYWSGLRLHEVPISFIPRTKGEAKGTRIGSILASLRDVFRFWWHWIVLGEADRTGAVNPIRRLDPREWE